MKHIFKSLILLAGVTLLIAGCAKKEIDANMVGDDQVSVSFVTALPNTGTKATIDNDGNAAKINHWVMEVRDAQNALFLRQEKDGVEGVLTQKFSFNLFKNQTYTIQFWADTKGAYNTEDLTAVSTVGTNCNLDSRDAFSANVTYKSEVSENKTVYLYRPFGQINIITTDLEKMKAQVVPETYVKYIPKDLKLVAKVPTTFNVKTQLAGPADQEITVTAEKCYADFNAGAPQTTILMDYIFASANEKDLVDMDFSFTSNGNALSYTFTTIPMQRNYRTNILGDLLSNVTTWTVIVDPVWTGEYYPEYIAEGSIAAANKALKEGKTAISIYAPTDYDDPIVFPAAVNGQDVSINVSEVANKTIKFVVDAGAQGPANLYITSDSENLDINTPNTHVVVNSGTYSAINAATSATTLVIGKNVTVNNLTITAGNVEINGIVNNITKPGDTEITYHIETPAALRAVAAKINATSGTFIGKIYLDADIDLAGEDWTSINGWQKNLNIDGQNHTIKNLKISNASGDYSGFISAATNVTIKNLNFDGAEIVYPVSAGENARAGVVAGQIYGSTVENCHVKNANITACQKTGGFIGYLEGNSDTPYVVKNCSVENVSIKSNDPNNTLQHGVGGFIGHISLSNNPLITITGCSAKNVTIADFPTTYGLQIYAGTFIGNACSNHVGEEVADITSHSIVLSNNTVSGTNTVLPTSIYSSEYFAWAGNAEERPTWKGNVYIDGQKWVPDYAFECGGVKYATLEKAIAAAPASADKTVRIIKAGQYTVQTLSASNCTIEATVEGVVFNHTPGSHARITGDSNTGVTVKNVTWNVGVAGYQYYTGTNLENCTVNGSICTRTDVEFKNCKFYNESDYNFWIYGTAATFDGCEFTCPGKNEGASGAGSALNLYHEANQGIKNVVVKNCKFTALNASNKYSAIYIKPETDFNVTITNCTVNDNFCNGPISGSKVWNVKNNQNKNTTVTVDGKLVYANGAVLSLSTPAQLVAFAEAVNAGNTFAGKTVYLEGDVDMAGIAWTAIGTVSSYPSLSFAGTFDGQNYTVSNLTCDATETKHASAGFFGSVTGNVKNLKMKNVAITSLHYAGAICGYCSTNSSVFENCHVIGGTITSTPEYLVTEWDNGDKVGGIVGYSQAGETVKNCSVDGITVKAYRDLGGICGASSATITGCVVKNSSIVQDNTNGYKSSIDTYHEILGRDLGATLSNNSFGNVTVKSIN